MVILVSPDSRGRINLSQVARAEQYAVEVDEDGVITLTPSVVVPRSEYEALAAIRPVLKPEEAFGTEGVKAAADAFYTNRNARSRGDWGTRVFDTSALHSLVWGDVA